MSRVTVEEVKEVFDTTLAPDKITACISTANVVVTAGPATSTNPTLSSAELAEIEKYLAAHFCSLQDPVSLRTKIGDADTTHFPLTITTAWGRGYNLTPYGQTAIALDRTGLLAATSLRRGKFRASPREDSDAYTSNLTKS
jgi:hypothetical protein